MEGRSHKGEVEWLREDEMGRLQGLCASHMNSMGRWRRFEQMLASWEGQREKIPLTISMSFAAEFRKEVDIPKREGLRIIEQSRRMWLPWQALACPGRFWCQAPKLGRHVRGCPTRVVGGWALRATLHNLTVRALQGADGGGVGGGDLGAVHG